MKAGALAALEGHPYLSSHVSSCDLSQKLSRPVPDQRRLDPARSRPISKWSRACSSTAATSRPISSPTLTRCGSRWRSLYPDLRKEAVRTAGVAAAAGSGGASEQPREIGVRNFRVFVSCDLRAELDDRHATSHSAIELRHLKSDGTSANHRQMLGPRCPLQPIAGGRSTGPARQGKPAWMNLISFKPSIAGMTLRVRVFTTT